ncbi:MBL fold metallo-hydrolase [Asticcacaulis sp. BYS171W]|uniref:MBL fold metallo-hydrolase n=1 Tax=Asticcacaulis aquaticus TaxID=2984212 RepID=A0ABT5HP07_9CAUL|nr:MBL fold metallo-hydrolase [Asticcacaulis aquaticus]MDC7681797.1 MBL fold metallo-hydrolase [Asticcacaulis aquaticus]
MTKVLKATILGSGCSTGVPRADGYWGRCDPANPKNRRSRCSALFQAFDSRDPAQTTNIVIDTSPDFRTQIMQTGIQHLDAVLWTHDHADQTHGIDDMRAFALLNRMQVPGYMDAATYDSLTSRFGYVFTGKMGYPPICEPRHVPDFGEVWRLSGAGGAVEVLAFDQEHGPIRSVGYRLGDIAYSSDISGMPEDSFARLEGVKVWIVDALRYQPHPTHAHLALALEWAARVRPERTILTNLHQDMDFEELTAQLPEGVEAAYDQMSIEIAL